MSRLPVVGSDDGTWGVVLNDFLGVAHASDGTIANGAVGTTQLTTSVQNSLSLANTALQTAPVTSVAGKTGAVSLTSADVGLGNVNNTSDANKPISAATQAALDAKVSQTDLDSDTSNLVNTSTSTAAAINSKITNAMAGSISVYMLAPSDPDPSTGSPAGLYFRRSS